MATAEVIKNLNDLQDILVEKYELENKIQEAPKSLSTQDEYLSQLRKEFIALNNDYEEVKQNVLKLKAQLEEATKSRESGEKGMDNINTHREYEALEKQIAEATVRENDFRKDLQIEEKRLSELNERIKQKEEDINRQDAQLSASKNSLSEELAEYNSKINELKQKEDAITPNLDQEILFKFERIIQRNREGIVPVRNGVCSACHMILPAQFANEIREGEGINFCPYCSRILYYDEVEDSETEDFYKLDMAGNLADFDDYDDEDEYESEEDSDDEFFDEDSSDDLYESDDDDIDSEDDEDLEDDDEEDPEDSEE